MAQYVILSKLTDEGRKTLKENPNRIFEVNKELESMGVRVTEQFAVLGPYDFVNIIEAPDNETIMRMSTELGARGSVELLTLPAIPVDTLIKNITSGQMAAAGRK
ncbi:MAG: GYD domain-containing protein [Nitrospirota bacterium]